jgi:hypothetical protein
MRLEEDTHTGAAVVNGPGKFFIYLDVPKRRLEGAAIIHRGSLKIDVVGRSQHQRRIEGSLLQKTITGSGHSARVSQTRMGTKECYELSDDSDRLDRLQEIEHRSLEGIRLARIPGTGDR